MVEEESRDKGIKSFVGIKFEGGSNSGPDFVKVMENV
jgi:hypothetical protein